MKKSFGSYLALPDADSFVPSTISEPNLNDGGPELLVKKERKVSLHPDVLILQSSAAGQLASNNTDIIRTATPCFVFHLNSFGILESPLESIQELIFFSKRLDENEGINVGDSGIT